MSTQPSTPSSDPDYDHPHMKGLKTRLIVAWLFVGIPLLYGVAMTVRKALPLFGV